MRLLLTFGFLVVGPLAGCTGCGAPAQPKVAPVAPAASPVASVAATESDTESEPAIVGNEGDEDLLPAASPPRPGTATLGNAALLAEADRQLAAKTASTYSHHTHVDEARGSYDYDCSGFVDYALGRAAPDAFAELTKATVRRPLSKHIVHFVEGIPAVGHRGRWHRVMRAVDLLPGDIVAWLKPADSTSTNTGHVMIVHGMPTQDAADPERVLVPIMDSTAMRHGASDSRPVHTSGLGTGTIVLVVDASGAATHFRWTPGTAREHTSPIALAHLD
jgi:hypothetical protein